MDLTQYYIIWKDMMKAGESLPAWQEAFVKFYQAFIDGNRWQQYLEGVGVTLIVTAMALLLGIVLGVVVAVIRTAHDQQRIGQRNWLLGIVNAICQVYVTIIRGTPMMVQLLIMSFVVFKSSRQFTLVAPMWLRSSGAA